MDVVAVVVVVVEVCDPHTGNDHGGGVMMICKQFMAYRIVILRLVNNVS